MSEIEYVVEGPELTVDPASILLPADEWRQIEVWKVTRRDRIGMGWHIARYDAERTAVKVAEFLNTMSDSEPDC